MPKSAAAKKFVSAAKAKTLKPKGNRYSCKACGKILKRDSDKAWLISFCESTGKSVRIQRINGDNIR